MTEPTTLPTTWAMLAGALAQRLTVRARYHGRERLLCPHLLGWKNGRPMVLAYQAGAVSSLPHQDQGWRSLKVEELEGVVIVPGSPWRSADNYSTASNCIDQVALAIALN